MLVCKIRANSALKGAEDAGGMRLRLEPRMLVYAVYLVEHEYNVEHEQDHAHSPTDNTAQAHDQHPDNPDATTPDPEAETVIKQGE